MADKKTSAKAKKRKASGRPYPIPSWARGTWRFLRQKIAHPIARRWHDFMQRRPHRTFRITRRRDYKRSFALPGYWAFTLEVWRTLWQHKWLFLSFFVLYTILSGLIVGLLSQESYTAVSESINTFGQEITGGNLGGITETSALFVGVVASIFSQPLSESQQIYSGILLLFGWLVMIWLLRQIMAGHAVKLRDGLYSAGGPIAALFVVTFVILLQLLPVALGLIVMSIVESSGFVDGGVEAMAFWVAFGLLAVLSLYWLSSSLVAMITVTLPGMYPFAALKTAGDLVVGRRVRIMLRLVWMLFMLLILWLVVLVPIILIDQWIQVDWLPLVPIFALALSTLTLMFVSTYVYLFYRRLLDDDAPPA